MSKEKKNNIKVNWGTCIGGYNDTLDYNVEINFNGKNKIICVEKHYYDNQTPCDIWEVYSNLELSDEDKQKIIKTVSENPPSIYSDAPLKVYNQESLEEIEMGD